MNIETLLLLLTVLIAAVSSYVAAWFNLQKLKANDLHDLEQKICTAEKRVTNRFETVVEGLKGRIDGLDEKLSDAREQMQKLEADVKWLKRG